MSTFARILATLIVVLLTGFQWFPESSEDQSCTSLIFARPSLSMSNGIRNDRLLV